MLAGCSVQAASDAAPTPQPPSAVELLPENFDMSVEAATALLELPVTTVPLELVLTHDQELNVRYVDLEAGRTVTISDAGGIAGVWTTDDAVLFARQPALLDRWDRATQTLTTTTIPSGDIIGDTRHLRDGSLVVHTFNLGLVRDFLFVYEASGEIRCSIETDDAVYLPDNDLILGIERSAPPSSNPDRVFTIDPTTCSKTDQLPALARFGRTLGDDLETLIISESVNDNESRLVRYEFDDGWTETGASDPFAIRGRPQTGDGAMWAQVWSDGNTDLYRISADTFEVEAEWRISVGRPTSWTIHNDAVWLIGCCPERLTKVDIVTGEVEHFPLPFADAYVTFLKEFPGGLLIGRPSVGYLFNFERERFERMPDWFLLEALDASHWIVAPGS